MTTPLKHPFWCDPEFCTVQDANHRGGYHQSRPATVEATSGMFRAAVSLIKGQPDPDNPKADVLLVDMTITEISMHPDDGEDLEYGFTMTRDNAEQLGSILLHHGLHADGRPTG